MSVSPAYSAENFVYDGIYVKHVDGLAHTYPGGSPEGATWRFNGDSVETGEEIDYWTIESDYCTLEYA